MVAACSGAVDTALVIMNGLGHAMFNYSDRVQENATRLPVYVKS